MEFNRPNYDLAKFSELNKKRCDEVFKMLNKSLYYWVLAINEEAGEVAGALKKLERGFTERDYVKLRKKLLETDEVNSMYQYTTEALEISETLEHLQNHFPDIAHKLANTHYINLKYKFAQELADVFIYLDLAATSAGINIWEAVREKFNQVSQEMNTDIKI